MDQNGLYKTCFTDAHLDCVNFATMPFGYLYIQDTVDRIPSTPSNNNLNEFAKGGGFWHSNNWNK